METLAPVIITIFIFTCLVIVVGGYIFTRHKERMSMIEKGVKAGDLAGGFPGAPRQRNPLRALMWGFVFTAIGLAVLVGMTLSEWYHLEEGIYPGLIALFGGIGLIIFYSVARKKLQQ